MVDPSLVGIFLHSLYEERKIFEHCFNLFFLHTNFYITSYIFYIRWTTYPCYFFLSTVWSLPFLFSVQTFSLLGCIIWSEETNKNLLIGDSVLEQKDVYKE